MAICPVDMKPCCDDLCYGGGCLKMHGEPMLTRCDGCKALIGSDGSDPFNDCTCLLEDFYEGEGWPTRSPNFTNG